MPAQQAAAHHGGQRERYDGRNHDRDSQRERELAKHPPDDPRHEQQRNENRDQRHRERDYGKSDLARATQRGIEWCFAIFDMADDVLDHHNGIVDHEAGSNRQRHQRQVVERKSAEPHDPERGDQRKRQRDAGNDRGADRAEKHKHHQHDQRDAENERELDIVDGGADGVGAVAHDDEADAGGHGPLQARQLRPDTLDRVDDVGAGLTLDIEDDRRFALIPTADLFVFESVDHLRDVAQQHRRVIAIGYDQRTVCTCRL